MGRNAVSMLKIIGNTNLATLGNTTFDIATRRLINVRVYIKPLKRLVLYLRVNDYTKTK